MQITLIATVTPERNIELPFEICKEFQAEEKFLVTMTEDKIILKKQIDLIGMNEKTFIRSTRRPR